MPIRVLDPTFGEKPSGFSLADRPASLTGLTIGIISNGKRGTEPFFEAMATELGTTHGAASVEIVVKGNYSAPAGVEVMDRAYRWNALIAGIGD